MINGLIAIGYKDLWDDYDTVDPLSLLKDIPTIGVLDFIVERQNEVLFAFSDIEAHMKRIYEMRCYLDENAIALCIDTEDEVYTEYFDELAKYTAIQKPTDFEKFNKAFAYAMTIFDTP